MTWTQRIEMYLQEGRSVSGGKGDKTAQASEASQASFNSTLQGAFAKQFSAQTDVLNYLKGTLEPQIKNPTGLDQATKSAMNTNVIDNAATTYQNALKGVQARTAGQGGPTALPNGVQAQVAGQLAGQEAGTESQGLLGVQQQDAALKQQNYWNAVNGLNGVASQTNPLGYAGAATSGSNAVAGLSEAYTQSNQSQLLGALGGIAGGAGTAFGGWLKGH